MTRVKALAGIIFMLVGIAAIVLGCAGLPFAQDLMPITILGGDAHSYYRVVPTGSAQPPYVSLLLIGAGVLAVVGGIVIRRRKTH